MSTHVWTSRLDEKRWRTVNADVVLRPLLRGHLRKAAHCKLSAAVGPKFLLRTIGRDRARADDAATEALLDHLLRSEDVCVHEAEQVDAHFVLDEAIR